MTADPFDGLGMPSSPMTPRPEFVAALRRRLTAELFPPVHLPDRSAPMANTETTAATAAAPSATDAASPPQLVPYLCCRNAAAALDFYATALGGLEQSRMVGDDGRIGHAEMILHGARIMLADEHPEIDVFGPEHYGGTSVSLNLEVDDVDAVYARALDAGAVGERAPQDEFYGARTGIIRDPFGHRWFLQTTIEQVSPAEMGRRAGEQGYDLVEPAAAPAPVEVGYLTFATSDTARARQFFGTLFGWAFEAGNAGEGYAHIANTRLPMGLTPEGVGQPPTPYFRVSSVAEYAARVQDLGGTVLSTDSYESGASATCKDDQGMTFLLWEPAPGY